MAWRQNVERGDFGTGATAAGMVHTGQYISAVIEQSEQGLMLLRSHACGSKLAQNKGGTEEQDQKGKKGNRRDSRE